MSNSQPSSDGCSQNDLKVEHSHLSSDKSSECSQDTTNPELLQHLTDTAPQSVLDINNIQLPLEKSLDSSEETINSKDKVCKVTTDIISQLSLESGSQEITENKSSKFPSDTNLLDPTNGYQNSYDKFIETITIDDSSESSEESIVSESSKNESEDDENDIKSSNKYQTLYCQECKCSFICMFVLKYHRCSKEPIDVIYPCYICHTPFTDEDEFCVHMQTSHSGMVNKHEPSPVCWTLKHEKFLSMKNKYTCELCPAAYPTQELVDAHVRFVHF